MKIFLPFHFVVYFLLLWHHMSYVLALDWWFSANDKIQNLNQISSLIRISRKDGKNGYSTYSEDKVNHRIGNVEIRVESSLIPNKSFKKVKMKLFSIRWGAKRLKHPCYCNKPDKFTQSRAFVFWVLHDGVLDTKGNFCLLQ